MDQALRALERAACAAPGDEEAARRWRAALRRLPAAGAAAGLDRLEGGLMLAGALGEDADPARDAPPRWQRVGVGGEPLLPPAAPRGPLVLRWAAEGELRWASAGAVLVERRDGALAGLDPATGAEAWAVPSARSASPAGDGTHELEERRGARFPWGVAPWGAVELAATWDARLAWRRKGSWTPRGRSTEREPVGRDEVHTEVALQLVAPAGGWSTAAPRAAVERGEAVAGGALALSGWDDALFRLALDPAAPTVAVRWRDADEDWVVLTVHGLDGADAGGGGPWADDAGWRAAPDEEPHPPVVQRGWPLPQLEPEALVWEDGSRLSIEPRAERGARRPPPEPHDSAASGGGSAHRSEAEATTRRPPPEPHDSAASGGGSAHRSEAAATSEGLTRFAQRSPLDQGALVRGRWRASACAGPAGKAFERLWVARRAPEAGQAALEEVPLTPLLLEGRRLVLHDELLPEADPDAAVALVAGALVLVACGERLLAFGPAA